MYAIIATVSIHITSASCYFEAHPLGPLQPYLQWFVDEVMSFSKSHDSTLSVINSLGTGPAAAMVDVCYREKRHIVQKVKRSTRGSIFENAQLLRITSFVNAASRIYVVVLEQSFHNHQNK